MPLLQTIRCLQNSSFPGSAGCRVDEALVSLSMNQGARCATQSRTDARPLVYHFEPSGMSACWTCDKREARCASSSLSHRAVLSAFPCKHGLELSRDFSLATCHQHTLCQRIRTWTTGACRGVVEPWQ